MGKPWYRVASIAASGTDVSSGVIPLIRARTLSVTIRCTYNGAATLGLKAHFLHSPDGDNLDTVAFDNYTVTHTAGATVQETYLVAVPEHGGLEVKLENLDAGQSVTAITVWYTLESWPNGERHSHGDQSTPEQTD